MLVLFATVTSNVFAQTNSRNGRYLPTQGDFRVFVVFAEIADDTLNLSVPGWDKGQMPNTTTITNYLNYFNQCFSEASFDTLNVILDYYPNLMQISMAEQADYLDTYGAVFSRLDTLCANGQQIQTVGGLDFPNDFDVWKLAIAPDGGLFPEGSPNKTQGKDSQIDCILIFWRENSKVGPKRSGGEFHTSRHSTRIDNKYVTTRGLIYSDTPQTIVHEFAHGIVGDNYFHSGGANSFYSRIYMQNHSGYSILSGWNHYFYGCNGWDRYRLGWKPTTKQYYISAQNTAGQEVASDLIYGQSLSNGDSAIYILKNFATSGDAVRIKLPYLHSESANVKEQWLWFENHQFAQGTIEYDNNKHGIGSKMHKIPKGIYMNIQVGNENFASYSNSGPNSISPVNSFGYYDFTYSGNAAFMSDQTANPFAGLGFASYHLVPIDDTTTSLFYVYGKNQLNQDLYDFKEKTHQTFNFNGVAMNNNNWAVPLEYYMGSVFDAFYQGNKIALTTNPAPVPRMTFSTNIRNTLSNLRLNPQNYDNRKIYLNGICIRVLEQMPNGDVKISVRWNDFKILNNIRWCGDIVLNEQVDLQSGNTILLDQGLTPVRPTNPIIFNGEKIFASPTIFTCKDNSLFKANSGSTIHLKNNSTLIAESGSEIELDGGSLIVESGSTLQIKSGATLRITNSGNVYVKGTGYLCIETGAIVILQDYNSVIRMGENATYGVNPLYLTSANCSSVITYSGNGSVVDLSQDVYIQNETITNNRYIGGKNIYVGHHVTTSKPQGNVLITNNANVVFDCQNVIFDTSFKCDLGASFKVVKQ